MRLLRYALLGAPALLLVQLLACEDTSSSSGGGFFVPESGTFDTGSSGQEAGPLPDNFVPDTALPDNFVPPKGVKVVVTKDGVPQKDVRVVPHDSTGAALTDTKTDATGTVTFATAPAMVTVLSTLNGSNPAALTYLGTADGDVLNVALQFFPPELPAFANFTASINAFANATFYNFNVGESCGSNTNDPPQPTNISLYNQCLAAQNAVLATVYGNAGILGFGFLKNQAKPAANATVVLPTITATAAGTLTMTGSNLPASSNIEAELRSIANSFGYYTSDRSGNITAGGYTFPIATGFADAYQSLVVANKITAGPPVTKGFLRRDASNGTAAQTLAYDFGQTLPYITNGVTGGTGAPARPDVTLTADASLAATDGGLVRIKWNVVGGLVTTPQWTFVVPPGTTTFKVPALPADATAYVPQAGATVMDALFVESGLLPGYAQLKALPMSVDGQPPTGTDVSKPLPLNGTVKITSWGRYIISPPG